MSFPDAVVALFCARSLRALRRHLRYAVVNAANDNAREAAA